MNKLVIIIRGGCVVNVYGSVPEKVEVIDLDDLQELHATAIESILTEAKEGLSEIY